MPVSALLPSPPIDLLRGASLFLDFDGTLVEIADRPDGVVVGTRLTALLARLVARPGGRVAIVTGRPAGEVQTLLPGSGLTIVGSHGMEFLRADGRSSRVERPAGLDDALAAMRALADERPGLLVEAKPLGVALHFRQRPGDETACVALAQTLAARHGLLLQPGKMMIEVRAPGGDKGAAIRALSAEPALGGMRPLFMGDDHTDEPGFAAAAALGGAGILVGPARDTAARYRLADVSATLAWLEAAADRA